MHSVLQRRQDLNGLATQLLLTRDELMETAREYGPFTTVYAQPDGSWAMGQKITLTRVEGIDYLKCHDDGFACDDFGDLTAGALA